MFDTGKEVYTKASSLLAIKGQVSVQYLDGQMIEGEFITQDQFNIFLSVKGEPAMISRSQIRFIKGKYLEQIEEDNSQDRFVKSELTVVTPESEIHPRERFDTEEYHLPMTSPPAIETEDEGRLILETAAAIDRAADETMIPEMENLSVASRPSTDIGIDNKPGLAEAEEDKDGTLVIEIDQYPLEEMADDDEGTVILPADSVSFPWADDDDGTIVLEPPTPSLADEEDLDMTAIISDAAISAENDVTVILSEKKAPEITAKLTCIAGPHTDQVFQLKSGITTMGRSADNVIVLSQDKEISRHHAIVLQESGRFVIQDQNSLNGTFVNDEQISGPRYLQDGDEILVGLSLLKYQED
jgi:hypothetical protein